MNQEDPPSSADTSAENPIIRVTMKAFEYTAEFQFLENAVANECEIAPEPVVGETGGIGKRLKRAANEKRPGNKEKN